MVVSSEQGVVCEQGNLPDKALPCPYGVLQRNYNHHKPLENCPCITNIGSYHLTQEGVPENSHFYSKA